MVTTEEIEVDEPSSADRIAFPVDAEHGGIRFTIGIVFFLGLPVSYILINLILPADSGLNFIAVIGAILITFVVSQQIESQLKQRWKSGRQVVLDADSLRVEKHGKPEITIDGSMQVNVLRWRFEITRRTRVAKGWHMVACALEQEGVYLAAYTFMPPEDFTLLQQADLFKPLASKKSLRKDRDLRLAGEQRRLFTAENYRWNDGAEMAPQDFKTFLAVLQERFPKWMY